MDLGDRVGAEAARADHSDENSPPCVEVNEPPATPLEPTQLPWEVADHFVFR